MKILLHTRSNSFRLYNRLAYFEFPQGSNEIQQIVQKEKDLLLPKALADAMSPEKFKQLSAKVESKGKAAAEAAVKGLDPKKSVEEAKTAAKEAFRDAAKHEITAAMKDVDQAKVPKLLDNIFTSTSEGAALSAATSVAYQVGGTIGLVADGMPFATAVEGMGAVVGASVAAAGAAALGTAAAGYQARELYTEVERGGFPTKGNVLDGAKASAVESWNVGIVDSSIAATAREKAGGDKVLGTIKHAAETASDLNFEKTNINDGLVDKSVTLKKISQMQIYAAEVIKRLDVVLAADNPLHQPEDVIKKARLARTALELSIKK